MCCLCAVSVHQACSEQRSERLRGEGVAQSHNREDLGAELPSQHLVLKIFMHISANQPHYTKQSGQKAD